MQIMKQNKVRKLAIANSKKIIDLCQGEFKLP
jgi:hypothetical protein